MKSHQCENTLQQITDSKAEIAHNLLTCPSMQISILVIDLTSEPRHQPTRIIMWGAMLMMSLGFTALHYTLNFDLRNSLQWNEFNYALIQGRDCRIIARQWVALELSLCILGEQPVSILTSSLCLLPDVRRSWTVTRRGSKIKWCLWCAVFRDKKRSLACHDVLR